MTNTTPRRCGGLRALPLAGALTTAAPCFGQIANAEPEPGEILVTAQRRVQSIEDVPLAVSAFSQQSLDALQVRSAADLQLVVPNLTFTATNVTDATAGLATNLFMIPRRRLTLVVGGRF